MPSSFFVLHITLYVGRASGEPGPQQRMFYILRHVVHCQQSKQAILAETYNIGDEFYLFFCSSNCIFL